MQRTLQKSLSKEEQLAWHMMCPSNHNQVSKHFSASICCLKCQWLIELAVHWVYCSYPDFYSSMYTLTLVCKFSILFSIHFMLLPRRIHLLIKSFLSLQSLPSFSWPWYLIQGWYYWKKLQFSIAVLCLN